MKLSVIIVNYNGKKLLKTILDSIGKSAFKDFEIIVLDNASADGSQEFIRRNYPKAVLVENRENMGYSGINNALKHCKGEYVLFLNNDMELPRECIGNMMRKIEKNSSIGMIAPKLANFYDKKLISGGTWLSRGFYNGHVKGDFNSGDLTVPYLGVGLIRKSIIDKYGYLFDPDYFIYGEDVDLGLRIRLLGKEVLFSGDAIMHHMHAYTTSKSMASSRTTYLMERNLLTTFFKDMPLSRILLYSLYVFALRLAAILKDTAFFNFPAAFARVKAVSWVIFNFGKVLSKRKETQRHRKATAKFIMEVFSENHLFKKKFIV